MHHTFPADLLNGTHEPLPACLAQTGEQLSREVLIGRDAAPAVGLKVVLTEQGRFDSTGGEMFGLGTITEIQDGQCKVHWAGTGTTSSHSTGEGACFHLARATPAEPNHGLGDATIAAPVLAMHGHAEPAVISISSAPKPRMMETDGSMTSTSGLDGGLRQFNIGKATNQFFSRDCGKATYEVCEQEK
jgi:hypothetical protein